jgi:hypothetical protein
VVSILPLSTMFLLDFLTVPTVWYFFLLIYFITNLQKAHLTLFYHDH